MTRKGRVSSVDNSKRRARVSFGNSITPEILIASNLDVLNINDMVAVAFFSDSMEDGLIIAKF